MIIGLTGSLKYIYIYTVFQETGRKKANGVPSLKLNKKKMDHLFSERERNEKKFIWNRIHNINSTVYVCVSTRARTRKHMLPCIVIFDFEKFQTCFYVKDLQ